ncbi:MAG: right-handed parallel beta-helix repeat-containing protein, partial [Patescibacteria group bacterium]|nr:right-handed parallel beta-helix repeat-containing protein [Patescibacteria group bacterium]
PASLAIDQLFVDGRQQRMARYPNFDPNVAIYNGYAADAFSKQRAANWKTPIGGYIHAMHRAHWGGYHYLITGRNQAGEPTYEGGWQNNRQMGMHESHRFVENIFEELDAPGEWFHDASTSTLYYYPSADVDIHSATVEVVRLRHLIEFRGSQEAPVKFVHLRGVTFRHAARTFMDTREPLLRSDWTIYRGGAVLYEGAEDCELADCTFDQVGGNTIFVSNYNRRIAIRGCLISDSGASGVLFVGNPAAVRSPLFEYGERQAIDQIDLPPGPKTDDYPADCVVEDCLIRNTGRVEKQSAGVQISMARRITVRHCSIYGLPRAGINISEGTWGGHLIEHCDVFDTVLETGDHGSFNCWGRDRFWGLSDAPADKLPDLARLDAVETTVIRNSRWRCDHGWDIDLDDGASNYHVYNNLMLHGGLKFREGFHRIAENNIMVGNSFHPHVWYAGSGDVFRRNIVFTQYRPIRVDAPWGKQIDHNLLHAPGVREARLAVILAAQSGRDEHSITADALFVDASEGDYRVREGSPALAVGFENFAMDRFGVQSPRLRAIARKPELPEAAA